MPKTVIGPDNKTYEFPDEATTDQIKNYLRNQPSVQALMVNQEQPGYVDNTGAFGFLNDIMDRGKAVSDSIDYFNQLQELDDQSDEYKATLDKFKKSHELVQAYSDTEQDNWFTTLAKSIAADVTTVLGAGAAGGATGLAIGSAGGPVGWGSGAAIGAGVVGFDRDWETS
jgi:hypothetical protein